MNESVPVDREVRPDTDVHFVGDTRAAADARLAAEAEKLKRYRSFFERLLSI